jgi:long-subunit acyl-CoA synthetase (AMP-forming)
MPLTVITEHETCSAEQFAQQVEHCRNLLLGLGVKRVGLYLDNGLSWLIMDQAAQQAGITCIPLPLFFSDEQIRHCCKQARIDAIFTSDQQVQHLDQVVNEYVCIGHAVPDVTALVHKKTCNADPVRAADGSLIHKVTFTSGTTGQPKGVLLKQEVMDQVVQSLAKRLNSLNLQRHLCLLPLSVLLEDIAGARLTMHLGGTLISVPLHTLGMEGSSRINSDQLATAINHYQPHSMILLPQLLRTLTVLAEQQKLDTASFRFLAVGGGTVSPEWIMRARQAGLPVYEGYGLSECASVVSLNVPERDLPGSVGQALPHCTVQTIDGELVVQGPCFSGYLETPTDIASPFIDPAVSGVQTGDLASIDDNGFIHIEGRRKNALITAFGRNVQPEWPESKLLACEHILQAAVYGEAASHLHALIVADSQHKPLIEQHIKQINLELPDYARIGSWQLMEPSAFAAASLLTPNGRIKRDRLSSLVSPEVSYAVL